MIVRPIESLRKTAAQRPEGYLEDCLSTGTLSEDGTAVSFTAEQYRRLVEKYMGYRQQGGANPAAPVFSPPPTSGAGTELKKLLSRIGITATPTCSCNKRARTMDENGIAWCEENIETIVGWLREEAAKRKLPFVDMAGRAIVQLAIRRAKKAEGAKNA